MAAGDHKIRIVQTGGQAISSLHLYSVICQWVAPTGPTNEFVL